MWSLGGGGHRRTERDGLNSGGEIVERGEEGFALPMDLRLVLAVIIRDPLQHVAEGRHAVPRLRRKVRAAEERAPIAAARTALQHDFDGRYGGFGDAPKFPHPMNLEFLLRTWRASADSEQPDLQALFMATLTITRMSEGGL